MIWPAIIGGIASIAGGMMSRDSANSAARGMQYRPWDVNMSGLGGAQFENGNLNMAGDTRFQTLQDYLGRMQYGSLQGFEQGQANALGPDFLRGATQQADYSSAGNLQNLINSFNQAQGGQLPGIQSGLPQGMQGLGQANYNQAL